jgi:tRNA threonylcarbamoyladenosine biosynthesis protein TsaE
MELQISLAELEQFAETFWKKAGDTKVFLFHGEMGAGKTTTITAVVKAKGVKDPVSSPTFSIINEYSYEDGGSTKTIYHIDLYRLKDEEEIVQSGVEDCLYSGAICFVEWPLKAPQLFDTNAMHVVITTIDEQTRQVQLLSTAAFDALNMREQL